MTPKEKAKYLFDKYYQIAEIIEWTTDNETKNKAENFNDELGKDVLVYWNELAKQSALIAVDEILENYYKTHFQTGKKIDYWKEVKQEIEKL